MIKTRTAEINIEKNNNNVFVTKKFFNTLKQNDIHRRGPRNCFCGKPLIELLKNETNILNKLKNDKLINNSIYNNKLKILKYEETPNSDFFINYSIYNESYNDENILNLFFTPNYHYYFNGFKFIY